MGGSVCKIGILSLFGLLSDSAKLSQKSRNKDKETKLKSVQMSVYVAPVFNACSPIHKGIHRGGGYSHSTSFPGESIGE